MTVTNGGWATFEFYTTPAGSFYDVSGSSTVGGFFGFAVVDSSVVTLASGSRLLGDTLYIHGQVTGNASTVEAWEDLFIDGGSVAVTSASSVNVGSFGVGGGIIITNGGSLTASQGSDVDTIGIVSVDGSTVSISSGSSLSVDDGLIVESGTVTVDGTDSSAWLDSAGVALSGATATVTFSNNAQGTIPNGIGLATHGTGTTGTLSIQSGADLMNVGNINVATNGGSGTSGTLTITGTGSSVTMASGKVLTIGHSSTGTGLVQVLSSGALTLSGAGGIVINSTGTLTVNGGTVTSPSYTNAGNLNLSSSMTLSGTLTNNTGSGTKGVTVSGSAVTFSGAVTNSSGKFQVNSGSTATFVSSYTGGNITGTGTVNFQDQVNPGSGAASVDIEGNAAFSSSTTLNIQLGGTTAGTQYDQLQVASQFTLDGTLTVSFINSFEPAATNQFDILDWGTRSGTFDTVNLPAISDSYLYWDSTQLYVNGTLLTRVYGDFDSDGDVDGSDYAVWSTHFPTASGATLATGDADWDGDVDGADYVVWSSHFPYTPGSPVSAVPEPEAFALMAIALPALAIFARRRKA